MHHYIQIVITKLSILDLTLIFITPPPPPYQRLIRDYKKADATKIRKALDSVNWERLFDRKNVNAQVLKLNKTTVNVFRNYAPSKYLTIDDKDPVWMNETIKSKIKIKNKIFKNIFRMVDWQVILYFLNL